MSRLADRARSPFTRTALRTLLALTCVAGSPARADTIPVEVLGVDVTALLNANVGQSLRLRFAEVDNVDIFNFGVDDVRLTVAPPNRVSEPGPALLLLAGGLAAGLGRRLRRT